MPSTIVSEDTPSPLSEPENTDETATATAQISLPSDPMLVLQVGQFILLLSAVLYVARPIILPIVLAIMLKLLLQPGVRRIERVGLPREASAALTILAVFVFFVSLATALSGPARTWAAKLPEGLPRLQERLSFIKDPLEAMQGFLHNAETYMHSAAPAAVVTPAGSGLSETVVSGTAHFASGLFATIVVLYFLLISGDLFLRRLVEILPTFGDKRAAVKISQQIESDIAGYLMTVTMMNAGVGILTGLLMWACGLENPILWGALAFLLNYIPMLGPVICMMVLLLAGLLTLEPFWVALLPGIGFMVIHVLEGQFVTPILVARRFTLNPVVVIISLIFWYWMWGVPGAILAVPVLGIIKIVCNGIRPWAAVGHLIEG